MIVKSAILIVPQELVQVEIEESVVRPDEPAEEVRRIGSTDDEVGGSHEE